MTVESPIDFPDFKDTRWDLTLNAALVQIVALIASTATATADTASAQVAAEAAARVTADGLLVPLSTKGQALGVAPLDAGSLIPSAFLPPLSIVHAPFVVASQAAMLALSTAVPGDVAIRTDLGQEFILSVAPYSTLANWIALATGGVSSINGQTGTVALIASDVGAPFDFRTITTGTGLTGGGDLTANRTLAVLYGTAAGTAAQGNDARLSDARTPTNGSVTDAKVAAGAAIALTKIAGTAVATGDARLSDTRTPTAGSVVNASVSAGAAIDPAKVAGVAVVGTVTNAKMGTAPNLTVKGNPSDAVGAIQDISMTSLAGMLDGVITADQVAVDTTGGAVGPSVQTALQAIINAGSLNLVLN